MQSPRVVNNNALRVWYGLRSNNKASGSTPTTFTLLALLLFSTLIGVRVMWRTRGEKNCCFCNIKFERTIEVWLFAWAHFFFSGQAIYVLINYKKKISFIMVYIPFCYNRYCIFLKVLQSLIISVCKYCTAYCVHFSFVIQVCIW